MIPSNPALEFLYSFESPAEYERSCDSVFAKYEPANDIETQLVSHIAVATWLRHRYAVTMHAVLRQLQEAQAAGAKDSLIVGLTRSLVRFSREYRQQKKHISGCRAALKRARQQPGASGAAITRLANWSDPGRAYQQDYRSQEDIGYDADFAQAA